MSKILVGVQGRIAKNLTPEEKIVTKNEGYEVEFRFDESWNASSLKTAIFTANGQKMLVPFTGNVCAIPMLVGVELLHIGVQSNDVLGLKTTVAARVDCELSADDLSSEEVAPPTESVYNSIIRLIEEGKVKGEKGDKGDKGDKGEAGAINFIPVNTLPTENIDTTAIYAVPITDGEEDNKFAEYAYINGRWEKLGEMKAGLEADDYVKKTQTATSSTAGLVKVSTSYGMKMSNGYIMSLPATDDVIKAKTNQYCPIMPKSIDLAVKVGLTDNKNALTNAEKSSACEWLGAELSANYRLVREITLAEDVQEIEITTDDNGKELSLKEVFIQFCGKLTGGAGQRTLRCSFNGGQIYQMYHFTASLSADFLSKDVCQWIESRRLNIPNRVMWTSKYSTMLEVQSGGAYNNIQGLSGANSTQYCDIADKSTSADDNSKIKQIRYGLANTTAGLLKSGGKIFIWGLDDE